MTEVDTYDMSNYGAWCHVTSITATLAIHGKDETINIQSMAPFLAKACLMLKELRLSVPLLHLAKLRRGTRPTRNIWTTSLT